MGMGGSGSRNSEANQKVLRCRPESGGFGAFR